MSMISPLKRWPRGTARAAPASVSRSNSGSVVRSIVGLLGGWFAFLPPTRCRWQLSRLPQRLLEPRIEARADGQRHLEGFGLDEQAQRVPGGVHQDAAAAAAGEMALDGRAQLGGAVAVKPARKRRQHLPAVENQDVAVRHGFRPMVASTRRATRSRSPAA